MRLRLMSGLTAAVCIVLGVPAMAGATLNVTSFGAIPNDAGDDLAAFNAAVAAVPVTGGEIFVPAGTYLLSSELLVVGKPIAFRGEGQRVTILKWTNSSHGINYQALGANRTFTLQSMSLLTAVASGGSALRLIWPSVADHPSCPSCFHGSWGFVTANVWDVHIGGATFGPNYWLHGIYGTNVTSAKFSQFNIIGNQDQPTLTAFAGIRFEGFSLGMRMSEGDIYGFSYGIRVEGTGEGIDITQVDATEVDYGFSLEATGERPGTNIVSCHTNSRQRGIQLINRSHVAILGNLNYKRNNVEGWIGIYLVNANANRVIGNHAAAIAGGVWNHVVLHGSTRGNVVSGNSARAIAGGANVWMVNPGADTNFITGNFTYDGGISVVNGGVGNMVTNNFP